MALKVIDASGTTVTTPVATGDVFRAGAKYASDATTDKDTFYIQGSATKVVRVRRIMFHTTTSGTAAQQELVLRRRSAAVTGGTAVAPTVAKMDPTGASATAVVKHFTGAGTDGAAVADLWTGIVVEGKATSVGNCPIVLDFTSAPIILRGTSDVLGLYHDDAFTATPTSYYMIEWEESAT